MKVQEVKYLYAVGKCNLAEITKEKYISKTLQVNIDQIRVKWESLCDM